MVYHSNYHEFNHYHNFKEMIIYQPELSNILFYIPNTKYYTPIFCRTVWNKLIRKNIITINIFRNKIIQLKQGYSKQLSILMVL